MALAAFLAWANIFCAFLWKTLLFLKSKIPLSYFGSKEYIFNWKKFNELFSARKWPYDMLNLSHAAYFSYTIVQVSATQIFFKCAKVCAPLDWNLLEKVNL